MEWFAEPEAWLALATLTALEIVLGIDNIIFISILAGKLPAHQQGRARVIGLGMHIPKGYIYFAMAFSVCVEMLNLRLRRAGKPVKLHSPYEEGDG